jgi:hypothetical protein
MTKAIMRQYSGPVPANREAALADNNVLLVEFVIPFEPFPTVYAVAIRGGIASFYRVYGSDDAICYRQGDITLPGGGGEITMDSVNIIAGQPISFIANVESRNETNST